MEKFVMAGETAIRYREIGIGTRAIVLLHGYLESIEVWDDISGDLGQEYRVILMDIPGHGISEVLGEVHTMEFLAATLAALLNKIGVVRADIIGHSMGGYVALAFAHDFEQMCNSITLFHSTPFADNEERRKARQREIEIIKSGKKELLTTVNPGKSFAPHNRKRFTPFIDELSEQAMLTEDDGIIALLNGIASRKDMSEFLQKTAIKQLFVFGKHDEFIPHEYATEIAKQNPQAEIVWLENSGHMGFVEERAESFKILKNFLG